MKHRRIVVGCLVLLLLVGMTAFAIVAQAKTSDPTVLLDAEARQFQFQNVKPYSGDKYPNLFQDKALTAIMPGDQVTEEIIVKAEKLDGGHADIYLSVESINSDISSQEAANFDRLMEQAELTVSWTGSNGSISHNKLERDGRVLLGSFHEGDSITITLHFGLPITAGNDLQDLKAKVGWVFQAEIYPKEDEPDKPDEPVTPGLNNKDHVAYIIGRPDGYVYPNDNITRAEVAAIFFRLLDEKTRAYYWAETNNFTDVPAKSWYNTEVSTLANAGILKGRTKTKFEPKANITRAEVAVVCSRFFKWETGSKTFSDIQKHWARDYIERAAANGAVYGYPDGTFRPNRPITRAEFMTIVNRILNRVPDKDHLLPNMIRWPDNMNTKKWYYAQVQEATNSHTYSRPEGSAYETWVKILPAPDWNALEKEWSALYSTTRKLVDSRQAEYN